jgi:hypothetical protein
VPARPGPAGVEASPPGLRRRKPIAESSLSSVDLPVDFFVAPADLPLGSSLALLFLEVLNAVAAGIDRRAWTFWNPCLGLLEPTKALGWGKALRAQERGSCFRCLFQDGRREP